MQLVYVHVTTALGFLNRVDLLDSVSNYYVAINDSQAAAMCTQT